MFRICSHFLVLSFGLFIASKALAAEGAYPAKVDELFACQTIENPTDRLQCMDKNLASFEQSASSGEILFIEKERYQELEREMFGFTAEPDEIIQKMTTNQPVADDPQPQPQSEPEAPKQAETSEQINEPQQPSVQKEKPKKKRFAFRKKDKPQAKPKEKRIVLPLAKMATFGRGKVRFYFENGQVWEQTDSVKVRKSIIRLADTLEADIYRGAIGNYLLRINNEKPIRVKRIK